MRTHDCRSRALARALSGARASGFGLLAGRFPARFAGHPGLLYLVALNFGVFRALQLGLFLFVPFVVQWSIGNFVSASGMILWGLLAPVGAIVLYSARESIPWFVAYIVLTLATGYVDYELAWLPPRGPKASLSTSVLFFAPNFAALSAFVSTRLRFPYTER